MVTTMSRPETVKAVDTAPGVAHAQQPSTVEWVPISKMKVLRVAQRDLNDQRAKAMAEEFDPDKLGMPVVNIRDGVAWVIDGQHRIKMLEYAGWGDQSIQCETYHDLTDAQMAEMFLGRDARVATNPVDRYRIGLTAGRKENTDIQRVADALGLVITARGGNDARMIRAIQSVIEVYRLGGNKLLLRTLAMLRDSFPGDPMAFKGPLIKGVALVYDRYGERVDDKRLQEKLSKVLGGANGVLRQAETTVHATGKAKNECVADTIVKIHNSGRGTASRLEPWWA